MRRHATLLLVSILSGASPVWAQTKPSKPAEGGDVDEARQHFQRGVDLYREGSYDAAFAEFTKAYELSPNYRVLFNLAQVQSERHDYVAALNLFEKYLAQGGTEISADRRDQVTKEITALKARVAQLTVEADVEGAELLVDGISVGELPLKEPVLVSAGVRQIQVRKPGYETDTRTETIAGGDAAHFEFKLKAIPVAAPVSTNAAGSSAGVLGRSDEMPPEPESHPSMLPFWITLTTTGLLTGGAITFGVLAHNADQKLDSELGTFPGNAGRIDDARSTLKRDALITDILSGAAIASGAFCIYFGVTGSRSHESSPSQATLRIAPAGTGLAALGRF